MNIEWISIFDEQILVFWNMHSVRFNHKVNAAAYNAACESKTLCASVYSISLCLSLSAVLNAVLYADTKIR